VSGLRRELGRWDLTAIGVNQVIGGSVFLVPASIALALGGGWSWIAFAATAFVSLLIGLCFAEAASRFQGTGGAYLYTRQAFGRFAGFEVGWMLWVTRVTSWASVVNGLADALGYYWPGVRVGAPRMALIAGVVAVITAVNLRGIKQSAWIVNALTIGKLTPLAIFIVLGLPHVSWAALSPEASLAWSEVGGSALVLIFAYGGYEVVPVPAGETKDPTRAVPFAMVGTILISGAVMVLAQIVAVGTLPGLAQARTPLADAALLFIGASGAFLMTAGAAVSMSGNNMGQSLSGSRNLFALAEQGDLPRIFGHIHERFRTPDFAILFTGVLALGLALSGSFAMMAKVSALARLVVYAGTCASVLVLRRQGPAPFTVPFGPVIPIAALLVAIGIAFGADDLQRKMGLIALAAGAVLYLVARRSSK
jgi:APA family basic amino acid/polyamine antiporter